MSTVALCRVCLASNTKMHHIANTPYQEIFEKLATELCTADGRPETVCWVCLSALRRGRSLADTARAADEILTQLSLSGIQLNEDTVSVLDRKFIRKLAWTPIQALSFNEGYEHSPAKVEIKQEPSGNDLTDLESELCDETQVLDQPQAEMNNSQVLLMLTHTEMDLAQEKQTGAQEVPGKELHTGCQTIFNIKEEPLSYDEVSESNCSENNSFEIQIGKTELTDDVEKIIGNKERSEEVGMFTSQEDQETKLHLKKFKRDEVADKKDIKATVGGTSTPVLKEAGARMLASMGNRVKPLCNEYDSATELYFDENIASNEVEPDTNTVPLGPSPPPPKKKIIERKRKIPARKGNTTKDTIKMQYYRIKRECATLEEKTRFVEYNSAKKQKLLDLEIKIKTAKYENIQKTSTGSI